MRLDGTGRRDLGEISPTLGLARAGEPGRAPPRHS